MMNGQLLYSAFLVLRQLNAFIHAYICALMAGVPCRVPTLIGSKLGLTILQHTLTWTWGGGLPPELGLIFFFYCDWLWLIYLRHFHGNTFGEIPLDVFKVHLCSAACYMWHLRNQRHITHQYKQLKSLIKMKWFFLKQMFWQKKIQLKKAGMHDENLNSYQYQLISDSLPQGTGSVSSSHIEPCVF